MPTSPLAPSPHAAATAPPSARRVRPSQRVSPPPGKSRRLAFFAAFLQHPRTVGAVLPSSKQLAAAITRDLDRTLPETRPTVIELGPGTGSFTADLLHRLPPHAKYLGIELDPRFVRALRRRFPADRHPGARFTHGSAEHLNDHHARHGLPPVGLVVSGLPFASLPTPVRHAIVDDLQRLLPAGAAFRTFQYVHAARMKAAQRFRRHMDRAFGPGQRSRTVVGNVPPAFVLEWRKSDA